MRGPRAPTAAAPVASSVPQPAQPTEAPTYLLVTKQLNVCVTTFFEDGTFIPGFEHDFRFLCADLDVREVNAGVLRALVSHGAGKITPGMRIWSTLGWYELTATALMRGNCCPPGTPPLQVPPAGVPCDTLRDVLQEMTQVEPGADRARQLTDAFAQGVYCFFSHGVPRPYYYRRPPNSYAHDQFVLFMDMAVKRREENGADALARSQP